MPRLMCCIMSSLLPGPSPARLLMNNAGLVGTVAANFSLCLLTLCCILCGTPSGLPGRDGGGVLRWRGGYTLPLPLLLPGSLCLHCHAVCHSQGLETNCLQVSPPLPASGGALPIAVGPFVFVGTSCFTCAVAPLQGTRLRRHRRGGSVQPPGQEGGPPEPQPHQHAQLLQLQQQHGQPEQPPAACAGRLQRPRVRLHVSQSAQSVFTFGAFPPPSESGLSFIPRNQNALFGGTPRYENVPLIGRGSPPPSVRWAPQDKSLQ